MRITYSQLVESTGISVVAAGNCVATGGKFEGRRIRDLTRAELASQCRRRMGTRGSDLYRWVICARIFKGYQQTRGAMQKRGKTIRRLGTQLNDAKQVRAVCQNCSKESVISTHLFDRASTPRCFDCGGSLTRKTEP